MSLGALALVLTKQCELWDLRSRIEDQMKSGSNTQFIVIAPNPADERSQLRADLSNLLQEDLESDVSFLVEEKVFCAHKVCFPSVSGLLSFIPDTPQKFLW